VRGCSGTRGTAWYTVQKTTPLGTIFVTWRSGAMVLKDKTPADDGEGACSE